MMGDPTELSNSAPILSQKQRRAALRKERRKRKRQALAQARELESNGGIPSEEEPNQDDGAAEEERQKQHEEWLERERIAQEAFRLQAEREEAAKNRKEEEERRIKEEWESNQRKEKEEKEQRQQEKRDREEAVQKMLDEAENQLENSAPWMNPEAPVNETSKNYGTERDAANCPFFLKTGACRFGDRCSRRHNYPTTSPTLMVRGMFVTFGMEESRRDDYDIDACLEHSEEDLHDSFLEFYHDVLPEFRSIGKVVQFKVSCNYEPHLKGNVYVQFDTEELCKEAFIKFNGRWYAGRQLHCEICPVTRWKNAICGLFDRQKCSKGKHCNFLHVFRNPGNEFWEADRDFHLSPNRSVRGSQRDGWHSERYGGRSWRQRRYSRSPVRSARRSRSRERRSRSRERRSRSRERRSRSRERRSRSRERRSRSRERRSSYLHREESRSSNARYSERRSRNGDRSRSRSRQRHRDRDVQSRSKEREEDPERLGEARVASRGGSKEKNRKRSRERSLKPDKSARHGRHKHSKKSKKKNKKKHKRKSLSPEGKSSTGESEGETVDNQSAQSPTGEEVSRDEPAEEIEI